MSLEVKGWLGLLLPPCLLITAVQQPGTSSPPSQLKRSSTGVIWMCKASFTNNSCSLPWSSMVVSSQWIGWWCSHACSATADFSIIPLSQASRCSFSLVSNLRRDWRRGYTLLEVKGWWTIAPPSLPPHHSGPATRDFQSSISVEALTNL